MSIKNSFVLLLALSLLLQIFFSVYYSSEIISQNENYANLVEKVNKLEIENQNLQSKLAVETSIGKLYQYLKEKEYRPIWQEINLNQP